MTVAGPNVFWMRHAKARDMHDLNEGERRALSKTCFSPPGPLLQLHDPYVHYCPRV